MKFIRYIITILIASIFSISVNAEIPEQLKGTWTNSDRLIFLEDDENIAVILKEYYGWYYDRAVEPEEYSELLERPRNIATQKHSYQYSVSFTPLMENVPVWEMNIQIDKKTKSIIPLAIVDGKIYLNFLLKVPYDENQEMDTEEETNENPFFGYWQGLNCSYSIRISPRKDVENLISWYITQNGVYRLRFWKSKMLHEDTKAVFSDSSKLYTINKHIFSAGINYSCVSGRSSNIRNVEKYPDFPFEYKIDGTGNILALGKPYLSKVEDKNTSEKVMEIVKEANSRRKPLHPSLFNSAEKM